MSRRLAALSALCVASALWLAWGGRPGTAASQQLAAVLGSACLGAAAVLWVLLERRFAAVSVRTVLGLALLLRLIAIQASPLLEDDHFRYLWDGLRTATTLDPYRLPPAAFFGDTGLPPVWQDVLNGINNPDLTTVYGPVLQALFALAHGVAPADVRALQALLLLFDMAVLGMLAHAGTRARGLLVYAVHPLVLKEALASAHPDGLVALLLLLALLAWQRRRPALTGAMLGLAVCTKVAACAALPLLLLAPPRAAHHRHAHSAAGSDSPMSGNAPGWPLQAAASLCAVTLALYLPLMRAGGSDAEGLAVFVRQWRFNPLLYRLLEPALPGAAARVVAALLIVAGVGALGWHWHRSAQRRPGGPAGHALPPLDAALALLVLLAPVVNPWYWMWLLALALCLGRGWLAVAALAAPLAYLNSTVLAEAGAAWLHPPAGPYAVVWPAAAAQLLVLALAWWYRRCLRV